MPYWAELGFIDANSPVMEQLLIFYDHSMIVIISILAFLVFFLLDVKFSKKLNLGLIENHFIEFVWTILPVFLLVFIALPRLRLLYLMEERFNPRFSIKVIGHQWFWRYEYTEFALDINTLYDEIYIDMAYEDFAFLLEPDNFLAIPMNVSVRMLIRRVDVIHSWTIQRLGVKTDAIPGRLNQINFYSLKPGVYYGACSEICGVLHSYIPIAVKILPIEDFISWMYY